MLVVSKDVVELDAEAPFRHLRETTKERKDLVDTLVGTGKWVAAGRVPPDVRRDEAAEALQVARGESGIALAHGVEQTTQAITALPRPSVVGGTSARSLGLPEPLVPANLVLVLDRVQPSCLTR